MNPKAIINLKHLRDNIKYLKSNLHSSSLMPIVKANAYGHGYINIVKILKKENIKCVAIATSRELNDIIMTNLKLDILHLGKISFDDIKLYLHKYTIATINSLEDVLTLKQLLKSTEKVRCHIKVDTGMNRMGCSYLDFDKILNEINNTDNIFLEGVYSHLACSENTSSKHNNFQIDRFKKIINKYKLKKIKFHLINSGGIFNYPDCHFDFVRSGISIYGISPYEKINKNLKPIMKFVAPIVLVKNLKKFDKVGYGCTYVAKRKMKIAIAQCGYADGIPFSFGNTGAVYYNNHKLPIIGKVSMDLICLDCSAVENIEENQEVIIWGGDLEQTRLENISKQFNRIPYLFLTGLSERVERIYINE